MIQPPHHQIELSLSREEANRDAKLTLSWWVAAFRQTGWDLRSGDDLV